MNGRGTWNDIMTRNGQGTQKVVHRVISKLREWYLRSRNDLCVSSELRGEMARMKTYDSLP
jgi:hypothetical protein